MVRIICSAFPGVAGDLFSRESPWVGWVRREATTGIQLPTNQFKVI